MSKEQFRTSLQRYLPEASLDLVYEWLHPYPIKLKIAKPRTSKLGDFKVINKKGPYFISVNGDLNPYAFLITLTHEVAHMYDFIERKTLREAHGAAWKKQYITLLHQLIEQEAFPSDLLPALRKHIARPKAASCSDPNLLNALRGFDEAPSMRIKDLPPGSRFTLTNGRQFELGELRRTRFKCFDPARKKWYLVHGEATVASWEATKS